LEDDRVGARRAALLLSAGLVAIRLGFAAVLGLAPQEAYYWQYARHPALSYLDHPPMAAEWIRAGTALLGPTAVGIRLVNLLAGGVLCYLLYLLGERLFSARVGLIACALSAATVLFELGGFVTTPDGPLVLFWAAALLATANLLLPVGESGSIPGAHAGGVPSAHAPIIPSAVEGRTPAHWYVLGTLVGLAFVSKYTAALLPPAILLCALGTARGRAALKTPHPYLALVLAVGIFTPVIAWNAAHHFASFAFQTESRLETVHGLRPVLVGRFLGLQTGALGPLTLLGVFTAAFVALRRLREPRWLLIAAFGALPLLLFAAVSPFHWVKMNWPAPAYVALLVGLAALLERWPRWTKVFVLTGAVLALLALLVPLVPAIPFSNRDDLITGWDVLARRVQKERAEITSRPVVVGADYKTASELSVHLPDQPFTASRELFGQDGLMYGFWDAPKAFLGRTLLVVSDRRDRLRDADAQLHHACAQVTPLAPQPVFRGRHPVTTFDLWRCDGYRGPGR
jgi:4-amino-4-deoxy-L-arabinose transferase-like glycosyltransferase